MDTGIKEVDLDYWFYRLSIRDLELITGIEYDRFGIGYREEGMCSRFMDKVDNFWADLTVDEKRDCYMMLISKGTEA